MEQANVVLSIYRSAKNRREDLNDCPSDWRVSLELLVVDLLYPFTFVKLASAGYQRFRPRRGARIALRNEDHKSSRSTVSSKRIYSVSSTVSLYASLLDG